MQQTSVLPAALQSRQHFPILDGLRGVAAIAVVIFHFMEIAVPDYHQSFIAHAYLAVDFFFCLSGFVIAYAYDERLKQIGVWRFIRLRLIRLHPLVVIGSVIGLVAFVFDPFNDLYDTYATKTFGMFVASCLMIPYPLVHERYFNLFHLNPPTWSLFWEYIANVFYALVLVKISNKILWALALVATALLCFEANRAGYLGVGWGGDSFAGGGIRVFYSFIAGILVYRSGSVIKSRAGFAGISILLLLVFMIPFAEKTNPYVDCAAAIILFPLLVAFGAGAVLKPAYAAICKFSGEISYPLYMIHYPFIWLFMSWVELKKPSLNQMTIVILFGVPLLIALAYTIMIWLDLPIRKYLKLKMEKEEAEDAKEAALEKRSN
ncbi:acyltransferase family protein [Mucilaginibacter celer]|uniref:Acyltransferase n=1 Tax=Mucilaginibacter celer TaxID=2305508 RepID=A0A494VZ86_9SPHI|nr:acyltransferase [Mucilaginibacter celer]AYL99441.1 acyltransferase [Mucilaginibacter celer]